MKWNLRLAAANRGIWKASDVQRRLAERGLVISAGKMSGLWSGDPASIKLDDLDVICTVVGCGVEELLIPEPAKVAAPAGAGVRAVGRGVRRVGRAAGHPPTPGRTITATGLR
jgi:DNA-binding Xre family transcriptional regulator